MIDKLTYDEILNIAHGLKKESDIIEQLGQSRNIQELIDFCATVEGYSKYLENTIEINKDADEALKELKSKIK